MRLHEEETLFRQAVTATAAQLNIPEIFRDMSDVKERQTPLKINQMP